MTMPFGRKASDRSTLKASCSDLSCRVDDGGCPSPAMSGKSTQATGPESPTFIFRWPPAVNATLSPASQCQPVKPWLAGHWNFSERQTPFRTALMIGAIPPTIATRTTIPGEAVLTGPGFERSPAGAGSSGVKLRSGPGWTRYADVYRSTSSTAGRG